MSSIATYMFPPSTELTIIDHIEKHTHNLTMSKIPSAMIDP